MMQFSGTIKHTGVYDIKPKDGGEAKRLISFTAADELGNLYAFQMWSDDKQFDQLAAVIDSARFQPVQLVVAGYSVREREMKDKTKKLQANFIVTNVVLPSLQHQSN